MTDPIQLLQRLQSPKEIEFNSPQPGGESFGIEKEESKDSFSDMLIKAVNGVDETMKTSETNMQDYIAGKTDDVHEVMISMQRAQLSFQLMVEVRNKAIETYNEISRMSI